MVNAAYWFEEKKIETEMLAEYSSQEVRKHLEYLSSLTRRAGTADELKAAGYIKDKLDEFGIEGTIYEFDAFISLPKEAELHIRHPVQQSFPCISGSFSPPTPDAGLEAELISPDNLDQKADLSGKIVLIVGDKESREKTEAFARRNGAAAKIYVTPGKSKVINVERLKSTWGNPTPETIDSVPKTPSISICNEDGHYLAGLIKQGPVRVKLKADSMREYRRIHLPVGMLTGAREPEKFILFGGHYCSWFNGATDNAAANSLMIEMARLFSKYRKFLGRSVRFAWWSGHEQGTFAGSTWYVDNFWDDIRENAVAYLCMDGLGRIGSSGFECRNTEEIRKFHETVVKDTLNLQIKSKRVTKTGDQSFHGIGLPSLIGKQALKVAQTGDMFTESVWYSHSAMDTLDKLDVDLLAIPFKANAVSILRLCNRRVLPFEFITLADEMVTALKDLQKIGKSILDLTPLMAQIAALKKNLALLKQAIDRNLLAIEKKKANRSLEQKFRQINTCLIMLSRILISIYSSKTGRYRQDPAGTKFRPFAMLQPIASLSSMDRNSRAYKALRTMLVRERNKVSDAIHSANYIVENALSRI